MADRGGAEEERRNAERRLGWKGQTGVILCPTFFSAFLRFFAAASAIRIFALTLHIVLQPRV